MVAVAETQPQSSNHKKTRPFKRPAQPEFTDKVTEARYRKGRLALACRVIHAQGWGVGCSVNLSARDVLEPSTIWVLPAGRALAAIRSDDLIQVNIHDGTVIPENRPNGRYDVNITDIHRAIYAARPEVGAIVNGSTPHCRAFAMNGMSLKMILQDSCTFYNRIHQLPSSVGLNAGDKPQAVADCLKDGKGLVMQNRGILMVGATIECPLSYYIRMESLCRVQLMAEAAARGRGEDIILVGEEEVKYTFENNGSEHHAWMMSIPYMKRQEKLAGDAMVI